MCDLFDMVDVLVYVVLDVVVEVVMGFVVYCGVFVLMY